MNNEDVCPGLKRCPYRSSCYVNDCPKKALFTLLAFAIFAFCWWAKIEVDGRAPTIFEGIFALTTLVALAEDPIKFVSIAEKLLNKKQ